MSSNPFKEVKRPGLGSKHLSHGKSITDGKCECVGGPSFGPCRWSLGVESPGPTATPEDWSKRPFSGTFGERRSREVVLPGGV